MRWSPNRAYSYFARGKVASVTSGAGAVSQYLYDGDGVRVSKSEPSGSTQIISIPPIARSRARQQRTSRQCTSRAATLRAGGAAASRCGKSAADVGSRLVQQRSSRRDIFPDRQPGPGSGGNARVLSAVREIRPCRRRAANRQIRQSTVRVQELDATELAILLRPEAMTPTPVGSRRRMRFNHAAARRR